MTISRIKHDYVLLLWLLFSV